MKYYSLVKFWGVTKFTIPMVMFWRAITRLAEKETNLLLVSHSEFTTLNFLVETCRGFKKA